MSEDQYLTIADVARRLNKPRSTVVRWVRQGKIRRYRRAADPHRGYYKKEDIDALLEMRPE